MSNLAHRVNNSHFSEVPLAQSFPRLSISVYRLGGKPFLKASFAMPFNDIPRVVRFHCANPLCQYQAYL